MRILKMILIGLSALTAGAAFADYTVNLTFENGAARTLDELVVQDGKVILAEENLQVPFEQIQTADFTFEDPLTASQCLTLLKAASYEELISRIDAFLAPVKNGLGLRGNLDTYIQYKMKACFWAGKYQEAGRMAQLLQQKNSSYAPPAGMYGVLMMLEQKEPVDDVRAAFDKIDSPEEISAAMTEYIQGRLAFAGGENEAALKHFSRVLVYYRRDPEWVPASTFWEATVYEWDGRYDAVLDIKRELKIAYSEGYWGRRADELN